MRVRMRRVAASLAVPIALLACPGVSEAQITAEVSGGVGLTLVDMRQWSSSFVASRESGTTAVQLRAMVLPLSVGKVSVGGEFATQSLFWYTYDSCPGCRTLQPGTQSISSTSFVGVGRFAVGRRTFVDVGGGVFMVGGETRPGASAAFGYSVPIKANIFLPIKARADLVVGELVVPALSVGVSAKF